MPATYWLPLATNKQVKPHHLHAAFSGWFDEWSEGDGPGHHDQTKPYRINFPRRCAKGYGVELSVLTQSAAERLLASARMSTGLRFGDERVAIGAPDLLIEESWAALAGSPARGRWRVEFCTPTIFRSSGQPSLLPTSGALLRSPALAWASYGPDPVELLPREHGTIRVADLNLKSAEIMVDAMVKDGRVRERVVRGLVGWIELRCADRDTAQKVTTLLNLAKYCGTGSYKGRGLGRIAIS